MTDPAPFTIYALHAGDGRYRYVGLTTMPLNKRMYNHKNSSIQESPKTAVARWMKKIGWESVRVEVIDSASSESELLELEVQWIAKLRAEGFDLLNLTDGGEGLMNPAREVREKFRIQRSGERNHRWGKPHTPAQSDALNRWNNSRPEGVHRGGGNPNAKLSDSDVIAIRELYKGGGVSYAELSRRYGVTKSQIHTIIKRKGWTHV